MSEQVIQERRKTHGEWSEQAPLSQTLKDAIRSAPGYANVSACEREALDLICVKISRIVSGNSSEPDHWVDIGGYALLGKSGHPST